MIKTTALVPPQLFSFLQFLLVYYYISVYLYPGPVFLWVYLFRKLRGQHHTVPAHKCWYQNLRSNQRALQEILYQVI